MCSYEYGSANSEGLFGNSLEVEEAAAALKRRNGGRRKRDCA